MNELRIWTQQTSENTHEVLRRRRQRWSTSIRCNTPATTKPYNPTCCYTGACDFAFGDDATATLAELRKAHPN